MQQQYTIVIKVESYPKFEFEQHARVPSLKIKKLSKSYIQSKLSTYSH